MSYQRERDEFIAKATKHGLDLDQTLAALRAATTFQRLAEAQCNGDWPADNGERTVKPCARCESQWVPSVLKKGGLCPDCRLEDSITTKLSPFKPKFQGDPRGCVFKIVIKEDPDGDGNTIVSLVLPVPSRY